ncbi:glycosyltransferase [Desulfarculus baarsii]
MSESVLRQTPASIPQREPVCDIIMPVRDNLELTCDCLELLRKNTASPFRLIIIDDGSGQITARWLGNQVKRPGAPMVLIRHETSQGWTRSTNDGLAISRAPYICLMNNDVLPAPGWLERMIAHMEARPDLGLLQPRGNERELLDHALDDLEGVAAGLAQRWAGQLERSSFASGYCLLLRRRLYQALGPLDESYPYGLWADIDYCRRAQDLGYFSAVARDALVAHLQNRTFKIVDAQWRATALEGERMFIERWGYRLGFVWLPQERLGAPNPQAARQMARLYNLADHGCVFYVLPKAGERAEEVLSAHGLCPHGNVFWEDGLASLIPRPLRARPRLAYLAGKGRARVLHRGDLARLDASCLPLTQLPPQAIGKTIRAK